MVLAAALIVLGQGVVAYLLFRYIKVFGSYTKQLVDIHTTNIQITEKQEEITEALERLRDVA